MQQSITDQEKEQDYFKQTTHYIKEKFLFCCSVLSRHANILSPYSKAVPAIIAKASTIYNPFIYAITHDKYR